VGIASSSRPVQRVARSISLRILPSTATEDEVALLKRPRFKGKRPISLYYYRELQNLRDPLHFCAP
jgi:hypothetical protein